MGNIICECGCECELEADVFSCNICGNKYKKV